MTAKPHEARYPDPGRDPGADEELQPSCPLVEDDLAFPNRRMHDADILRTVREIKDGVDRMHLKLFGEVTSETEHGRIPRLEGKAKLDNARIKSLERWRIFVVGGAIALWGGVWAMLQIASTLAKFGH